MKFNSQICTSIEQSRRLLALGLKKETADMIYVEVICTDGSREWEAEPIMKGLTALDYDDSWLPAWSLYRLWELLGKIKKYEGEDELSYPRISLVEEDVIVENPKSLWVRQSFISPKGVYENIINCLEELIKGGYFPKEYLV